MRYKDFFQCYHLGTIILIKTSKLNHSTGYCSFSIYLFFFFFSFWLNVFSLVILSCMELHSSGTNGKTFSHIYTAFPLVSLPQSLWSPNMGIIKTGRVWMWNLAGVLWHLHLWLCIYECKATQSLNWGQVSDYVAESKG